MNNDFYFICVPIVLLYMFLAYTKDTILFSNTPVGKFIAICIIAYYTNVNIFYGVFVCMLILVYYQTDLVEDILHMEHSDFIESRLTEMNAEIQHNWGEPQWTKVDDETTIAKNVTHIPKSRPQEEDCENAGETTKEFRRCSKDNRRWFTIEGYSQKSKSLYEGFQSGSPDIYSYRSLDKGRIPDQPDKKEELMAMFRKEHCVNGALEHKGMAINPEMTEHVFREFKPDNEWRRCNPCDSACSFSIIEERIQTELAVKPMDSNDFFQSNLESMSKIFNTTTDELAEYFEGVKSYAIFN
jgi:hypothetical protein